MSSRGPDDSGDWDGGHVKFGHRRLSVIDPTPEAAQPFVDVEGRGALVYNGELYNEPELRRELHGLGWSFRTASDTETLLAALVMWGDGALARLRGMFAFAFYDSRNRRVLLARDPFGMKPLYWTRWIEGDIEHLAFASSLRPLVERPDASPRPDVQAVSAYLTTIRTTIGERTMYEGVRTLEPGAAAWVECGERALRVRRFEPNTASARPGVGGVDEVREAVSESVRRHLRSDVPVCALLSGGLDSSILALLASKEAGGISTYCSGAIGEGEGDDFDHAREVSEFIGSRHVPVPVTRERFSASWEEMIERLGTPLSTPNEVAILEVASRLRQDGNIVVLSGEGADELFGGYSQPLRTAAAFEREKARGSLPHAGDVHLADGAWISPEAKPAVLREHVWRPLEGDLGLLEHYRSEFDRCCASTVGRDGLQAHLMFLRRINLSGLLLRLDSATMIAGVEGRTPFADLQVADAAIRLPASLLCDDHAPPGTGTKVALRRAFGSMLPERVVARPKASFPLPFQEWVVDHAPVLLASDFAREIFTDAARHTVAARATSLWQFAWPMVNVALWGARFG